MPDESATVAASPFCRELRSKKYYALRSIPMADADILDASGHCWCRLTMQVVGPDAEMAGAEECRPGRSCYRSGWDVESGNEGNVQP